MAQESAFSSPDDLYRRRLPRRVIVTLEDLDLTPGEAIELLERMPFGELDGAAIPEVWDRPAARRLLERHAARKRAISRLARRGSL